MTAYCETCGGVLGVDIHGRVAPCWQCEGVAVVDADLDSAERDWRRRHALRGPESAPAGLGDLAERERTTRDTRRDVELWDQPKEER